MKRSNFYTKGSRWGVVSLLTLVLLLGVALPQFIPTQAAVVTDGLDVKIVAAPNFVVDLMFHLPRLMLLVLLQ